MPWSTRKANLYLSLALGLLLLLPLVGNLDSSWLALPFFVLFWLYLFCVLFLIEWLVLWRTKKEAPELPFGPKRWRGNRKMLYALVGYVALFTLLREGAFAPDLELSVQWYSSNSAYNNHTNNSTNYSTTSGEPPRFAGRYTSCNISCTGDYALCTGLKQQLYCDSEKSTPPNPDSVLYISGSVSFGSAPFCYTPLYKDGSVTFQGILNLAANANNGGKSGSFSINGSIDQDLFGFSSCYAFLQMMGSSAGSQTVTALNQFIQSN